MHDVDTSAGQDKCRQLMDLEEKLGFRSTFNLVPERYEVSASLIDEIKDRGFGLGVHGLKHDGKLFVSREIFLKRALRVNKYLKDWGTKGFSTPSMLCNLNWMNHLNIEYATSTFDTDPFEPQPQGIKKIFPFWVKGPDSDRQYLEMPYTLPQDFTLFILMHEKDFTIWKRKAEFIADKGAMLLFNSHPDYMNFNGRKSSNEEYDFRVYSEFLKWLKSEFGEEYWLCLPSEMESYFRSMCKNSNENSSHEGCHLI